LVLISLVAVYLFPITRTTHAETARRVSELRLQAEQGADSGIEMTTKPTAIPAAIVVEQNGAIVNVSLNNTGGVAAVGDHDDGMVEVSLHANKPTSKTTGYTHVHQE
jgi:hypothetical protein